MNKISNWIRAVAGVFFGELSTKDPKILRCIKHSENDCWHSRCLIFIITTGNSYTVQYMYMKVYLYVQLVIGVTCNYHGTAQNTENHFKRFEYLFYCFHGTFL